MSIKNYEQAKSASFTLNNIGDTIEKWYTDPESNEMKSLVLILNNIYKSLMNETKSQQSLVDIKAIEESQKRNNSGIEDYQFGQRRARVTKTYLDLKNEQDLSDIHQYLLDSSQEKVDSFEQELFRNSGIYTGFIKMLEFDAEIDNLRREMA